ncbi:hypothetical protein [Ramlibacter sp. WS9]|uniref:hypothetical protein n=1 Tax=Ramlibacter sp. WS9 TaxID=1882741 RepID=UPI001141116B|nr:hypothetical protein [Ramlibacter sp. WS9]ROZ72092.1 hypothetical protein EEB15_20145 [Ramlibacter sp. WS9]
MDKSSFALGAAAVLIIFGGSHLASKFSPEKVSAQIEAAPIPTKRDCREGAAVLEKATRYAEKTANLMKLSREGRVATQLMHAESRGGEIWEVSHLSACSERAQKAYNDYTGALGQLVDGPKLSNWNDLTSAQQEAGLRLFAQRSDEAKSALRVELNKLREDGYSR